MKKTRNIGQEILTGIKEIKEWQQGKKKLKTTHVQLPRAADVAKIVEIWLLPRMNLLI